MLKTNIANRNEAGDKIKDGIANLLNSKTGFLIFKASLTFNQLVIAFTKAFILYHFDFTYYIQIETDV